MSTQEITIRSVHHFMYCPHRWGLIEIDKAWAENMFVTKANLLHKRVHDPENNYTARGKKVYTSVSVYNDQDPYHLYGVTDCLEFTEDKNGVCVDGSKKKYSICIVEYKPTKPKYKDYNEEDAMQVFEQKLCVDYVFGCDSKAELYYADVKKRFTLPFDTKFAEYDQKLRQLLAQMREYLENGKIPPIRKGQKCSGCSMKDLCMPTKRKKMDLMREIKKM